MRPITVRILTNPQGKVLNHDLVFECKTGDEGFAFIEAFQKKCGVTPRRDGEGDKRLAEWQAKQRKVAP